MLTDLEITDLALIDHAELGFGPGLNALTGETGAGKSLLVTSLELLLGERPRGGPAAWVREGAGAMSAEEIASHQLAPSEESQRARAERET